MIGLGQLPHDLLGGVPFPGAHRDRALPSTNWTVRLPLVLDQPNGVTSISRPPPQQPPRCASVPQDDGARTASPPTVATFRSPSLEVRSRRFTPGDISAPMRRITHSERPHLDAGQSLERPAPSSLPSAALLMVKTRLASDHAKIVIRARKSPPTWAVTQNQRADSDRRDDRIRTCDPLTPSVDQKLADLQKR